jgi:hypothetical protein
MGVPAGPGLGWTRHACMSRQRALQAFFSLAFGALADRVVRLAHHWPGGSNKSGGGRARPEACWPQCIIGTQISDILDVTRTRLPDHAARGVGFAVEWAHAVYVVGRSIRPDIVSGQIDVIPAERRQPPKTLIVDIDATPLKVVNGASEITAVEQSNAGSDEIERRRAMRLPVVVAVTEPTEPMERDGAGQSVPSLALVQHVGRISSQPFVFYPVECVERALDAPDLAESERQRALPWGRAEFSQDQRAPLMRARYSTIFGTSFWSTGALYTWIIFSASTCHSAAGNAGWLSTMPAE